MALSDPMTMPTCSGLTSQRSYLSALLPKADMCGAQAMSAFTPKADPCSAARHVRFGSEADMCAAISHVRFRPKSGHGASKERPPWAAVSPKADSVV